MLSALSISKAKALEVGIRGVARRPTTDVSPIIFKVDVDAQEVVPLHDVVEAVKLFESGWGYLGVAKMTAAVEPKEKNITIVAILRRGSTTNSWEHGRFELSSMDISGLLSSA